MSGMDMAPCAQLRSCRKPAILSLCHADARCAVRAVQMRSAVRSLCSSDTQLGTTRPPPHVSRRSACLRSGPPSHNPEAHKLYSNLAACYTKLGAYPEGVKAADRCIELAPDFAKGYSRKGTLQFLMKEYNKVGGAVRTRLALFVIAAS